MTDDSKRTALVPIDTVQTDGRRMCKHALLNSLRAFQSTELVFAKKILRLLFGRASIIEYRWLVHTYSMLKSQCPAGILIAPDNDYSGQPDIRLTMQQVVELLNMQIPDRHFCTSYQYVPNHLFVATCITIFGECTPIYVDRKRWNQEICRV